MTHRLTHSYSAIKLFDNCPLRYYKQRIEKSVKDEQNAASVHGERVHKALELRLKDKTPLPDYLAKQERVCSALEKLGGTVHAELEMVLNPDMQPTGWWEADAWLRSKLDVYVDFGIKAVILDWKTGKRRPDFFQLELSAVQAFIHYPKLETANVGFVWLKEETSDTKIYRRADFQSMLDKTVTKIKRIEEAVEEDVWPAKPGPLCNYCPAKGSCAFADTNRRRY